MNAYQQLETIFEKLSHFEHLQSIAGWDEAVMMPSGGGNARAKALATLQTVSHQTLTEPQVAELIESAKTLSLDQWQCTNLQWMEKQYQKATCLPVELVEAMTKTNMKTEQAWRRYRAENNWKDYASLLKENLKLANESAQVRAEKFNLSNYDVLLDDFSPGINQQMIDPIFKTLKEKLPAMIQQIIEKQETAISIEGPFSIDAQKQLGLELMQALGFDFNHGRLDVSHHPFCGGVPEDVRITTRYNQKEFITAAMGICHETGHARYEQGLPEKWIDQPVGRAYGMTVHESQSLLVEMQACRSPEFMQFLSPLIKRHFNDQEAFSPENLYKIYTKVEPGLIRVDADEVTYPLHVILRYDIEKALFKNEITIDDLPEVWNEEMLKYLNISTTNNYRDGVMQDVHWAAGLFGYFPAYTLGSLTAAQLYATALKQHPEIPNEIQQGNFNTLFTWLSKNIHQRASSVDFNQLMKDATGSILNENYFFQHIQKRYSCI